MSALRRALGVVEARFDSVFGACQNPFHFLGALTIFFFWVMLVTGLYLFVFFEFNIYGAYHSIERLTHEQWYLGGVMRSLHRYAADAAVVTMLLHLVREFVLGRYTGFRWYSWFSGVPLLWFVTLMGITGHWLLWDQMSQYIAIASAELMDWLPFFGQAMARNFLTDETLSDRFFTLMAFLHMVGIPLMLLFGIWFHVLRISGPEVNPPRQLVLGTLTALLLLSLYKPAVSQEFADLGIVPGRLDIDWFYLAIYPVLDMTAPGFVWILLAGVTLLLAILPWMTRSRREPVAVVDLDHCNGCGRCVRDCPFEAVTLQPRSDGRRATHEAVVNPALCASCGICTGACPYSSPFRSDERLVTGIDLPQFPLQELRDVTGERLAQLQNPVPIVLYGCDHGVDVTALNPPGVAAVSLPCIGMLPPPVIDHAMRRLGAAGVMVTGCASCDCYFRLGNRWMEERILAEREPRLRARVDRERIWVHWGSAQDVDSLRAALEAFRVRLSKIPRNGEA